MKKGKLGISILSTLFAVLMSGCSLIGGTSSSSTPANTSSSVKEDEKVTVKYVNGETVLKEEEVDSGTVITEWDPTGTVTDEFFGWYGEPTLTHAFDFTAAIVEDTTIFGSFVGYQKDERHWGIAGSGTASILASSNWGKVFNEEHYLENVSTDTKNIFEITVNLFANDQFQFTSPVITESSVSWGHQRGAGYLEEPTKDGVEYFTVGGSLGGDNSTANITVAKDGKYKFTLNTYPKGDFFKGGTTNTYDNRSYYDTITYEYLGECEEIRAEVETTFYMKGELITGWGDYVNNNTAMTNSNGKATLANVYLLAADQFMFASKNKNVATGEVSDGNVYIKGANLTEASKALVSGENNMKVNEDGYYTFVYDVEAASLEVTKVDYTPKNGEYYIDGSFIGWGGAGNDDYKLAQDTENPYVYRLDGTITLAVGDEIGIQYYDKTVENGWNGFYSAKNMVANADFDLTAGTNAKALVAGTYNVEFNSYSHLLKLTPVAA